MIFDKNHIRMVFTEEIDRIILAIIIDDKNFPVNDTWYKTGSTQMYANNQTSSSPVPDCRGAVHYYAWDGTLPEINDNTFTCASLSTVAGLIQSADADFYAWLNAGGRLGVDIRGNERSTTATWPGSYER